jgi:hypothetical protein
MARKKAKPGAVFIHHPDEPRGALISALSETLGRLDPEGEKKLRGEHGPAYLYMADASRRGEGESWYEAAPGKWQAKADRLLNAIVAALEKCAPARHRFSAITGDGGMIEWGFYECEKEDPEKAAEKDLLYGGFKETPRLAVVQKSPNGTIYKYRGRHILVNGPIVEIARTASGKSGILAEWESNQPFPHFEAVQVIDLMKEDAKRRGKRRRSNPVLPATVTEDMKQVGTKCAGIILRSRGYTVELQPIGEVDGCDDLTTYEGMVSATVLRPDETCAQTIAAWGSTRALQAATKVIDRESRVAKSPPAPSKQSRRASFLRRMLHV